MRYCSHFSADYAAIARALIFAAAAAKAAM